MANYSVRHAKKLGATGLEDSHFQYYSSMTVAPEIALQGVIQNACAMILDAR